MKFRLARLIDAGALIALGLLGLVAAVTWTLTRQFQDEVVKAYEVQLVETSRLAEAEVALWRLRYGASQFVQGNAATRRKILDEEIQWTAVIDGRLAAYARSVTTPEEQEALADLTASWNRYRDARPKLFELIMAGRIEEAQAWREMTSIPYAKATSAAFERQIELERTESDSVQHHSELVIARARWTMLGVGAALFTLVLCGYLLARYMLRPLDALRRRALRALSDTLGEEAAQAHAQMHSQNELDEVQGSFDLLVEKFSTHIEELRRTRQQLTGQQTVLEKAVATRTTELERTVARVEHQNHQMLLRNELGELLQSCLSVIEAGAVIARFLPQLFPGAAGAVYLMSSGSDHLVAVARWGETPPAESFAASDCWALRRGKAHVTGCEDTALPCAHIPRPLVGNSACVPLSAHGEALGLLHLFCACSDHGSAVELESALPEALAAQIGMALANLRLRETLHQQSIRDALTGLFNRRYLEGTLPRELARAQRSGRTLAVFMLDVDHFKNFNDTYGHDAGDAVLKALGRALRESCRQADIACRFGGEEFTIVLPEAELPDAQEWAERLLLRVRSLEVKHNGQGLPRITVSLGLALYPAHGEDPETLLQAADLALYDAKHGGRDRLVVYGEVDHQQPAVSANQKGAAS